MAVALKEMTGRLGIGFVYKTSFDKANRTSATRVRGLGLDKALSIFAELREKLGVPVLTDVHEPAQCAAVAESVDVLQIPAFLSRQTDLLVAAAKTGRAVNVKKGQFLAPWDMTKLVQKITGPGNANVLVTERGGPPRGGGPRIPAGAGAGGCGRGCRRRLHRDPRDPRPCPLRRPKYDCAQGHGAASCALDAIRQ